MLSDRSGGECKDARADVVTYVEHADDAVVVIASAQFAVIGELIEYPFDSL